MALSVGRVLAWLAGAGGATGIYYFGWGQSSADAPKDMTMKQTLVFFRHGARTPLHKLPGGKAGEQPEWEPSLCQPLEEERPMQITGLSGGPRPLSDRDRKQISNLLPGGAAVGQLTVQGRNDAFELGLRLRKRYIQDFGLIPQHYRADLVYARSTNITRTLESARYVLTGLFGAEGPEIPVQTAEDDTEVLYPNLKRCKALSRLFREVGKAQHQDPQTQKIIRRWAQLLDANEEDIQPVGLRDVIVARLAHHKPLPPAIDTMRIKEIDQAATDFIHSVVGAGPQSLSLAVGPMLEEFISKIDQAANNKASKLADQTSHYPRLCLYSAHDTSLMPLLMAFGVFDGKWPDFSAAIAIELYQHNKTLEHHVRVSYNEKPMELPGCDGVYCPLTTFKTLMKRFIPEDYDAACAVPTSALTNNKSTESNKNKDSTSF
eukprot:m.59968 g.59968  ORF g.59968 m.59968 type:complete len:433 (-) comp19145_c0_seq1:50-1348(-)